VGCVKAATATALAACAEAHPAAHRNATQNVITAWACIAAVTCAWVVSADCAATATAARGESDLSRLPEGVTLTLAQVITSFVSTHVAIHGRGG
jgi:hypothetical protein